MHIYVWFGVAIIASSLGAMFIKKYTLANDLSYIFLAFIMFAILIYSYVNIYTGNDVGPMYAIVHILQLIFVVLIGYVIFNETLTITQIIGLILSIFAMYLLTPKGEKTEN